MTPKSRFFQANISATLLWSTASAFAIALSMSALSAKAETLDLICQNTLSEGGSFTLRVDYENKSIELLNNNGSVKRSGKATVTESSIIWGDWSLSNSFQGELNRLSGEAWFMPGNPDRGPNSNLAMKGPCRRATQKF